jgi:hypothetical protein
MMELFGGSRPAGADLEMGLAYLRSAVRISLMDDAAFFAQFGEANRAVSFFAESADTVARRVFDLYQNHAQTVVSVFERAIAAHARALAEGCLPPDCLLLLAVSRGREPNGLPADSAAERPTPNAASARANITPAAPLPRVSMMIDPDRGVVKFEGRTVIRGAGATILLALAEPFRAATRAELVPEQYPFMPTSELMRRAGCNSEETLRTRLLRLRRSLGASASGTGCPPLAIDSVVENVPWRGYRLNPESVRVTVALP